MTAAVPPSSSSSSSSPATPDILSPIPSAPPAPHQRRARAPPAPPKRSGIYLTKAQKLELCEHSAAHPALALHELALWAQQRFRLRKPISESAVYHARRSHEALKQLSPRELECKILPRNAPVVQQFETRLRDWIVETAARGLRVDGRIIKAEAYRLRAELDHDGALSRLGFSNGWLVAFQTRYDLSLRSLRAGGDVVAPNRPIAKRATKKATTTTAPTATSASA